DQMSRERGANIVMGSTELAIGLSGAGYLFMRSAFEEPMTLPLIYTKLGLVLFTITNGVNRCWRAINNEDAKDVYVSAVAFQKLIKLKLWLIKEKFLLQKLNNMKSMRMI